jgi:hypothetical protein
MESKLDIRIKENLPMRLALAIFAMLLVVGPPAWAQMAPSMPSPWGPEGEPTPAQPMKPQALAVQGKIKSLDRSSKTKTLTLEDGLTLRLSESVATSALEEGAWVIATYEEQNGHKVATSVIRVRPASTS